MLLCRNLQLRAISSTILVRNGPLVSVPVRNRRVKVDDRKEKRSKNLLHTLNSIATGFQRSKETKRGQERGRGGERERTRRGAEGGKRGREEEGEGERDFGEISRTVQKRKVHIRFEDQVVRFVVPKNTSLAQILTDAKLYFGVESPHTELWDLSSDSTLTPSLHMTVFDLDSSPEAHFFFQILPKPSPSEPREVRTGSELEPEPEPEPLEVREAASELERAAKEDDEPERNEEWVSQKKRNQEKSSKDDYFRTTLFATNLTAKKIGENEQQGPVNPAYARTNKMVEKLVTSILASWQFKKFLENMRVPRLSETATAGFVASFLQDLEETQPKFCSALRAFAMSSQENLEQDTHALKSDHETLRSLRKAIKQFAIKGAALHASMELDTKRQFTDLRSPWMWYKAARQMTRKIIIHTGPTNSGKTFHALERLAAARSGMYCGPLRLLAHEVYEKLTARGIECSLITGQQKIEPLFATHVACTVEMTDTDEPVEVAVIDEFQMLGDAERGWAWTRAILGCPAQEIHLCGDGSAVDLVARICTEKLGDAVEIKRYERLSPLIAVKGGLHNGIQRGDAIVAFSRQKIHSFKQQIEKHTGFRCCVVYGSLPPEARSTQAALFNDPESGYDVLVASDAIGMGLNLNIRRVIFSGLTKFDGVEERSLTVSEIKQIAGRAGRYGSIYPEGRVTCLNPRDSELLVSSLQTPIPELQQLGLSPTYEQLEMFYMNDETKPPLSVLLDRFALYASIDNFFFLCDYTNIRELAVLLEPLKLDLKDLYTFCLSPADAKKPLVKHSLYQYASLFASDIRTVPLRIEPGADGPIYHGMPHLLDTFDDREKLKRLEELYLVADNYAWLSFRLPKFDEREKSLVVKTQVHAQISALLDSMSEAQGEASWSRIERMRKEAQLQRDAQAMRMMDKESRRDNRREKIQWDEETVLVNPAKDTQLPSPVQMDLAREKVQAQALAKPQAAHPRALPQPTHNRAPQQAQAQRQYVMHPQHQAQAYNGAAQAQYNRARPQQYQNHAPQAPQPPQTKEAYFKQLFQRAQQSNQRAQQSNQRAQQSTQRAQQSTQRAQQPNQRAPQPNQRVHIQGAHAQHSQYARPEQFYAIARAQQAQYAQHAGPLPTFRPTQQHSTNANPLANGNAQLNGANAKPNANPHAHAKPNARAHAKPAANSNTTQNRHPKFSHKPNFHKEQHKRNVNTHPINAQKTKQNEIKQNEMKQTETKPSETKPSETETKQNDTQQNEIKESEAKETNSKVNE